MANDPELKAMSEVFTALRNLDSATQKSVIDWVLNKLESNSGRVTVGKKRSPKPGSKRKGKRGRPKGSTNKAKRGRGRPKKSY